MATFNGKDDNLEFRCGACAYQETIEIDMDCEADKGELPLIKMGGFLIHRQQPLKVGVLHYHPKALIPVVPTVQVIV